jgi:serine/threonine protein kinase
VSTTRGQHLIGQEIGLCILEQLLGYGGSSAVFLAQSSLNDEKVAVKVFLHRSTMDKQMQKNFYHRFLREAEAASELDHPNILSIYSYGEHNGLPYIVMPYMPGGTLSEYVARNGPLSLKEAQQYIEQIASALDYAHKNGRVHCDVKPANILLDGWGHAMLSDFGIVRLIQPDTASAEQTMKSPETLMGTPDYISPEQALGEPLDGRSDIYSLAVTLFFLLAGSPPFKAESSIAMALMQVHETPPALGLMRVDITPQIDSVISKALSKSPEERYQTAGEFSAAFADAVANAEHDIYSDGEAKRRAIGHISGGKPAIPTLVTVQPAWSPSIKLRRIVAPLVLLLALILGSLATVNIVSHKHSTAQHTPTPTYTDYLADEQADWPQGQTYFFKDGQYHIQNTSSKWIATEFYESHQFTNFSLTVTTSELSGSHNYGDYYGIAFRSSPDQLRYYLFEINPWDDQYEFLRFDGQSIYTPLGSGDVKSLLPNFGQNNIIAVVVKDNTFSFSLNNSPVGTFTDRTKAALPTGNIGLSVDGQGTEVAFSHLQIHSL